MNLARLAALAAFSLLTLAAPAIAAEPQAGLWKVTIKGGPPGMPAQARENTMCITPEMVKDPGKAFTDPARQRPGMENCKQLGVQKTANGFTWRVQCTTAQMTMDTSGT